MANYRAQARRAAARYGLDPNVFERQIGAESNFRPDASSGKAFGIAQFTPATAQSLGINPRDPGQSLDAAAKLMSGYVKKYGSYENALRAYNAGPGAIQASHGYAETNNYVAKILHGASPSTSGVKGAGGGGGGTVSAKPINLAFDPGQTAQAVAQLTLPAKPQVTVTAPTAPSFAATGPLAPTPDTSTTPAPARFDVGQALEALQTLAPSGGEAKLTGGKITTTGGGGGGGGGASGVTSRKGVAKFDGKPVAGWIAPILQYARSQGWKGSVNSGYRSDAEQTAIYNRGTRPAAVPRSLGGSGSNHEMTAFPGGAVDVSGAQQLSQILARSKYRGKLVYAGSKDPVHFSHPHGGGY